MDESPPPLPERQGRPASSRTPGRPVRIQSIESIKTEAKPNVYVDSATLGVSCTPKLPPRLHKGTLDPKAALHKNSVQCENSRNEKREQLRNASKYRGSPELPPRAEPAPPLPHRARTLNCPKSAAPLPPRASSQSTHTNRLHTSNIQPTVLIVPEQPSFSFFVPPLRRHRHEKPSTTAHQPVTAQPRADVTLTLDRSTGTVNNSIICRQCGQCRCSSCTGDRELPERWLLEGNCRCSSDSVVDTASCLCCVKACFKAGFDNQDGSRIDPCACTEAPKCLTRWALMGALSLCLPCLCCYWPMQGGVAVATACYNSPCCRRRGCTCEKD